MSIHQTRLSMHEKAAAPLKERRLFREYLLKRGSRGSIPCQERDAGIVVEDAPKAHGVCWHPTVTDPMSFWCA
jgi:hypothetical protein